MDPEIFVKGESKLNTLTMFYLVPIILYRGVGVVQLHIPKKTKIFQGGGGPTFSRGGGGVIMLIPMVTYITCDFPGWGGTP